MDKKSIMDDMPYLMAIISGTELKVDYGNEYFLKTFGNEILNKSLFSNFPENHVFPWSLKEALRRKVNISIEEISIGQDTFNFNINYCTDKNILLVCGERCVTETPYEQRMIKEIIDKIDMPLAIINYPEMTYYMVNDKNFKFIQQINPTIKNTEEIINVKIKNIKPFFETQGIEEIVKELGKSGVCHTTEAFKLRLYNGEIRHIKLSIVPIMNSSGEINKMFCYTLDMTNEIQNNLIMEESNRMKEELMSTLSHELRTPLTVILSSIQLTENLYEKDITENVQKSLGIIKQNSRKILKLVNNFLELGKAEAGFLSPNYTPMDLVFLCESVVSSIIPFAESKGVKLIFDTMEEELFTLLDVNKIERVLLNLMSNAIKFTPSGGEILIRIEKKEDVISMAVRDSGIGIPKDKMEYIFDRYVMINKRGNAKYEGTGLGLSLVKKLVDIMEGNIEVISMEGMGTEFIINLPYRLPKEKELPYLGFISDELQTVVDIELSDI